MSAHDTATVSITADDEWQIRCTCGWATPWEKGHGAAWDAFMVHRELARREATVPRSVRP